MKLTAKRLKELGWVPTIFDGINYMVKGKLVLRGISGVWEGGQLLHGLPHFLLDEEPEYIYTEQDLNRSMPL